MENIKKVSLSWLVVSTRDYKFESDWFWDKVHHCCYGIPKVERTDNAATDLAKHYNISESESFFEECVLMPDLQDLDIFEAASFLRKWCADNQIPYNDDLDQYEKRERAYFGYAEDGDPDEKLFFCRGF